MLAQVLHADGARFPPRQQLANLLGAEQAQPGRRHHLHARQLRLLGCLLSHDMDAKHERLQQQLSALTTATQYCDLIHAVPTGGSVVCTWARPEAKAAAEAPRRPCRCQ